MMNKEMKLEVGNFRCLRFQEKRLVVVGSPAPPKILYGGQ